MGKAKGSFESLGGWKAVIAFAGGLLPALAFLYYVLGHAIPDLKNGQDTVLAEVKALRGDFKEQLSNHAVDERRLRESLTADVKAMQAHVIALKVRAEGGKVKASDIRDLVSNVVGVSAAEAPLLSEVARISAPPKMYSGFEKFKGAYALQAMDWKSGKVTVKDSLSVLLFAKDGKWEAAPNGIKVSYDGGTALLSAKPYTKREDLERAAGVFNSVAQAIESVGGGVSTLEPKKPVMKDVVPNVSPSPAPDSRAPNVFERVR